jgi:hypothetical protein
MMFVLDNKGCQHSSRANNKNSVILLLETFNVLIFQPSGTHMQIWLSSSERLDSILRRHRAPCVLTAFIQNAFRNKLPTKDEVQALACGQLASGSADAAWRAFKDLECLNVRVWPVWARLFGMAARCCVTLQRQFQAKARNRRWQAYALTLRKAVVRTSGNRSSHKALAN